MRNYTIERFLGKNHVQVSKKSLAALNKRKRSEWESAASLWHDALVRPKSSVLAGSWRVLREFAREFYVLFGQLLHRKSKAGSVKTNG